VVWDAQNMELASAGERHLSCHAWLTAIDLLLFLLRSGCSTPHHTAFSWLSFRAVYVPAHLYAHAWHGWARYRRARFWFAATGYWLSYRCRLLPSLTPLLPCAFPTVPGCVPPVLGFNYAGLVLACAFARAVCWAASVGGCCAAFGCLPPGCARWTARYASSVSILPSRATYRYASFRPSLFRKNGSVLLQKRIS